MFFRLEACTKLLGVILGVSKELWYHSPLCLNTEKNLARGKVRDKWFFRIGHERFTSGQVRKTASQNLLGLQFYNQSKSGEGEKNFFDLLE